MWVFSVSIPRAGVKEILLTKLLEDYMMSYSWPSLNLSHMCACFHAVKVLFRLQSG